MIRKSLLLTIAVCFVAIDAMAQVNIEKSWYLIDNGKFGNTTSVQKSRDIDKYGKPWSCAQYTFVDRKRNHNITQLLAAFEADDNAAYCSQKRLMSAHYTTHDIITTISYGYNLDESIKVGVNGSRYNYWYQLFRDRADANRRTAYVLAWRYFAKGDSIELYACRVVGADPRKVKSRNNQSVTVQADGTIIKFDGNTNNSVIMRPQDVTDYSKINIIDGIDFLMQFNSIRASLASQLSYADKDQDVFQKSIYKSVNDILYMCKNYSHLLNAYEKVSCRNSLSDLRSKVYDNSMRAMLDLALIYLR